MASQIASPLPMPSRRRTKEEKDKDDGRIVDKRINALACGPHVASGEAKAVTEASGPSRNSSGIPAALV